MDLHLQLALTAPCTDLGNAERFKARYAQVLRYDRVWFVLEGDEWRRDQGRERVLKAAHQCVLAIAAEAEAVRSGGRDYTIDGGGRRSDELQAWALKSASAGRIEAMLNVAKAYLCN